jgi:D-glycero-D-manno-heptose 1,7-bisphosphate phosphatase
VVNAQRAVFLDRDGVINRCEVRAGKPYAPRRLEDFRLLPGVAAAVRRLREAGFLVIVVTNQPDIGNGFVAADVVDAMHERLRSRVAVDDIRVCPHRQDEGCRCRKPRPGMLLAAARRWKIDLRASYVVGDRDGDIVAGRTVGCYTLLINRHYSEPRRAAPDRIVRSLPAGVRYILAARNR